MANSTINLNKMTRNQLNELNRKVLGKIADMTVDDREKIYKKIQKEDKALIDDVIKKIRILEKTVNSKIKINLPLTISVSMYQENIDEFLYNYTDGYMVLETEISSSSKSNLARGLIDGLNEDYGVRDGLNEQLYDMLTYGSRSKHIKDLKEKHQERKKIGKSIHSIMDKLCNKYGVEKDEIVEMIIGKTY